MKWRILVSLIFITSTVFGQLNLPLKFKDYEPQWIDFVHLDRYPINSNCLYSLRGYPRLIDDNLYIFYNVENYGKNGIIVEKRNIDNGLIDWRFYRDTLVKKTRIAISQVYMDENIDLVLFDEDHYINDGSTINWTGSHPAELKLNKDDGSIINEYHTDHSDPNNLLLWTIGDWIQDDPEFGLKLIKAEQGYRQIKYLTTQKRYYTIDVDSLGHLIKYDTLFLPSLHRNDFHGLFDLNDTTFISLIVSDIDPKTYDDNIQIMYRKMDHNLNILKELDVADQIHDKMNNAGCFRVDNEHFIIINSFQAADKSYAQLRFYLFNTDGILKDRIVHTITSEEKIVYGWLYPIVDTHNERLILSLSRQDTKDTGTYFELYTSNGDYLNLMRRFEVEGIEDHFRVEYGTMLPSGDLLLFIRQFDWDTQMGYPTPFYWHSLMLMSKDDLASTTTSHTENSEVILYPNPTDGKVNIESDKQIKSVLLFGNNGQNIGSNKSITDIDFSKYPSGIYNVVFQVGDGSIEIKRVVVH